MTKAGPRTGDKRSDAKGAEEAKYAKESLGMKGYGIVRMSDE